MKSMVSKSPIRERYPTVTVSVGREEQAELAAAAESRGFSSERGVLPGSLVRAILRRLWPFLRAVEFDPSQCDISREHAWMLGEMRSLRQRDARRWAALLAEVANTAQVPMPEDIRHTVDALAPPLATPGARGRTPRKA